MRVLAIAAALLPAAAAAGNCNLTAGRIIGRNQIAVPTTAPSADDCCDRCSAMDSCVAFTWHNDSKECWLKDNLEDDGPRAGATSGTNGRQPGYYACRAGSSTASLPFCDTKLSIDERVKDLVGRVHTDEAGAQLTARQSPTLDRLGLPSYYWGTNAIHGLQNLKCIGDVCPTAFPAPVGHAAAFNTSLVRDMGRVLGIELRAYYNLLAHNSLDTWSPTINLNRDPRWGRNVESPGEDPYVCGEYGLAYADGLQNGEDKTVLQSIVTLKHWVAYSVESYHGTTRHNFDAKVSEYDLAASYFPAWETLVKQGGAKGVMCSYNMLNGKPTCGNPDLVAVLRKDWGFTGYVTSDSDACGDIYRSHHYVQTATEAVGKCLAGGTDIDSGSTYSGNLAQAVANNDTTRAMVDAALTNTYKMRYELGLFDPSIPNTYKTYGIDRIGSAAHRAMSLRSSRKSMVLLKNSGGYLPLKKGGKVAVIGTSADSANDILGNYNGPLCPGGGESCIDTIYAQVSKVNAGGNTTLVTYKSGKWGSSEIAEAVAAATAADHVVLVASNAADGGGEGHDRDAIALETTQKAMVDAVVKAKGGQVAIVLINGGIIAVDDLKDSAAAILEAFMPGFYGAQAVAETLFGDNNPGGKMPVTMYHSNYTSTVDFLNMSMTAGPGRSYRYYTGVPLYPFGYGISYTNFSLRWSSAPAAASVTSEKDSVSYTVTVTNTGKVTGDEVVLAYTKPTASSFTTLGGAPVAQKQLFAFQRVELAPGESRELHFTASGRDFRMVDADGHVGLHRGDFEVVFSRGHGAELSAPAAVTVQRPVVLQRFRKWW
eukprot:TRINITY_DN2446_c0_g1_i1.p1 TRINITY_DN2446_c0_g1~~TRINITY_DN2446_c0_g1_i1.p1  ORF type:complete len:823 (+),score=272.37 TRINITY_DN2446_c0_g1_i1:81-2549(+)